MTDLDDLFVSSRESRDWDLPTESGLASIAIRRGRRRRRWHAAGAGAAAALVAITVVVSIHAGTRDPSSDAAHRDSLIASNRAEVLTQKRSALEAWELAGADKTVMALTNVDVPLVPRPEQETAADNRIIHSASSRDISVGFVGGPIDGPCARDYEARAIETAHGVVVTVFGHARYSTPIACDLAGLSRTTVVTLDAPLGDRALFDGATGRHLPDSTYRPSLPALSPSPSTTATGAASCATTGYGATLTGDSLVAFGCGDGPQVVTLRRSTHFPRFSLLWVSEVLQLLTKTTSDEEAAGLHAAAPSEFGLATISQVGGSLTIDLPAGFDKRNGILSSSANAQLLYAALKATLLSAKAPFTTVRITIVGSCSAWATMMESDTCTLP